jgi:NAD(P)-dependent dehydrogenase (short-subunit alcohol dehydrogenase family)
MPSKILITGASRGIGLELLKQLSEKDDVEVIGTMRKPFTPDFIAPNVKILPMDHTNDTSVIAAASQVTELDTLILNAAIGEDELLEQISSSRLTQYLDSNVVGPQRVVQAFLPALLARSTRRIIFISSTAGSIKGQINETFGLHGPYAVTKAAANMMAVQWHNELAGRGFTVVPLHPGWVATEMGNLVDGGSGAMNVEESAKAILTIERNLSTEDSAKFLSYDGSILPW